MVTSAEAQTLEAYDAIAPLYAEYSAKYRDYLNAVDQLVIGSLRPGMRLLDIGSGDGRRIKKIADHVGLTYVTCVEPSGEMARLCRQGTGFTVHELFGHQLDHLPEGQFDAVTALWNVFGHMPDSSARVQTLRHIRSRLAPGGMVLLDVNNRHNRRSYGRFNVWRRRLIDIMDFDERRGDARFEWKIGDRSFPASGHLFTPAEMDELFKKSGFTRSDRFSVDYRTGAVSASPFDGQLFFRLLPA